MDELFDIKKDAATDYSQKFGRFPVTDSDYIADIEDAFLAGIEWTKNRISIVIKNRILNDYNSNDKEKDKIAQGACASIKYLVDTL